jgi:alkylmercury lyase
MTALKPREPAVEIRPGVFRPDWSAVRKPGARRALTGHMAARGGLLDRWSHALDADMVARPVPVALMARST